MTNAAPDNGAHIHDWRFDGDDPYLVCDCGQRSDALTGKPVANGARFVAEPPEARREVEALRIPPPEVERLREAASEMLAAWRDAESEAITNRMDVAAAALRAALHPAEGSAETAHYWVGDHGVANGGNIPPPEVPPHDR